MHTVLTQVSDVSVIIGTFGDEAWDLLGEKTAAYTLATQDATPKDVIHVHGNSLHEARNTGAAKATGTVLVFLDADDRLSPNFCRSISGAKGPCRRPSVLGFRQGVQLDAAPVLGTARRLIEANYLIIGTAVDRQLFAMVGGFDDWECLEDWAFWLKCYIAGAHVTEVPRAVYEIHERPQSRGRSNGATEGAVAKRIREKYALAFQQEEKRRKCLGLSQF